MTRCVGLHKQHHRVSDRRGPQARTAGCAMVEGVESGHQGTGQD